MSKPKMEKNIQIPNEILRKLLTESEIRMLKNRFMISSLIDQELSVRKIAEKVGVGTDTVIRTIRLIDKAGLKKQLNPKKRMKSSTPWIFGKVNE